MKNPEEFNELTIEPGTGHDGRPDGTWSVYGHGTYEKGSVLEGQPRRAFIDGGFNSPEEAKKKFPKATVQECSTKGMNPARMPNEPPSWFDPMDAGERW